MNQSDNDVEYFLWIKGKASKITSLAHSIATLEIR
jgi:glucosylceramidase